MGKANVNKRPKTKQTHFEGMEPDAIKELDDACDAYVDIRDRRMELTKEEVKANEKVLELLKKHNQTKYKSEDFDAKITGSKEKVKVKRVKDDNPDDPTADL